MCRVRFDARQPAYQGRYEDDGREFVDDSGRFCVETDNLQGTAPISYAEEKAVLDATQSVERSLTA